MSVDMSTRYVIVRVIVRTTRIDSSERCTQWRRAGRVRQTRYAPAQAIVWTGPIMPVYQACENRADVGKLGYGVTGSRV